MYSAIQYKHWLMRRLEKKGLKERATMGFICSLKSCLMSNPDFNHAQLNNRMKFLGWNEFELDYHTLQLAIACFEAEESQPVFAETGFC